MTVSGDMAGSGTGDAASDPAGDHPARVVAQRSMAAVEAGDRDGWLALFADDAVVQDPVGVSPLDPTGEGHRGAQAIADFYDNIVAQGTITFEIRESYAAGDECANAGQITTELPDGSRSIVQGIYTYRLDEDGRIAALRAFWEFDAMQFVAAGDEAPS